MRGHEEILKMRSLEGTAPKFVFVNDFPCETDWFQWGDHATVCVAGDGIEKIDFRFAKGLTLLISAIEKSRAIALLDLGKASGAKVVCSSTGSGFNEVWRAN